MNSKNSLKLKKMVILSCMIAAAIIFGIIESRLQIIPVPGANLGFANLIVLVVLYLYGLKEGLLTVGIKVFFVALLSGRIGPTFAMSMTGGILALLVMFLFSKIKFGIIFVSLLGSISHQIGQIIAGIYVIGAKEIIYYLYIMIPIGIVTGILNGVIGEKFIFAIKEKKKD